MTAMASASTGTGFLNLVALARPAAKAELAGQRGERDKWHWTSTSNVKELLCRQSDGMKTDFGIPTVI